MICTDTGHTLTLDTPLGAIRLTADETGQAVSGLQLVPAHSPPPVPPPGQNRHPQVLDEAAGQLAEYLVDPRQRITVPVVYPHGASVQDAQVWDALRALPPCNAVGLTRFAERLGLNTRAVRTAIALTPVPLLIPRHRVLGSGGRIIPASERALASLSHQLQQHERIPALP